MPVNSCFLCAASWCTKTASTNKTALILALWEVRGARVSLELDPCCVQYHNLAPASLPEVRWGWRTYTLSFDDI